jgi:hypothetical protein
MASIYKRANSPFYYCRIHVCGKYVRRSTKEQNPTTAMQPRGLVDEFAIEPLAPAHLLRKARNALLLVLGEPCRREGRECADGGARQGGEGRDIAGVHCRIIPLAVRPAPWRAAADSRCGWRPVAAA